jgi:hypothetical protein
LFVLNRCLIFFSARVFVVAASLLTVSLGAAEEQTVSNPTGENVPKNDLPTKKETELMNRWIAHVDILGLYNPLGIAGLGGVLFRHPYSFSEQYQMVWAYIQGGVDVGVNPAYAQVGAHVEWMPLIILQLRLAYDFIGYFGNWGALMSFDSSEAPFGDEVVFEEREGQEELGAAHRFLFRPILRAKFDPVVIQNTTDIAWYIFNGDGPYFLEWEYDTLLAKSDSAIYNRTDLLLEAWTGDGDAAFLLGPLYELTHSVHTDVSRQRFGWLFFLIPYHSLGAFGQVRIFSQLGVNLQDRNRKNEFYALFGIGSDWLF